MTMTAKERQRMQRLEAENRMLRERVSMDMNVYSNNLIEIIEMKAMIELIKAAIEGYEMEAA